jgi:hypothetical protein
MPHRRTRKRLRSLALQPLLNIVARRNRRARELAATMQLRCAACGKPLAAHVRTGNKWIGCRKAGA